MIKIGKNYIVYKETDAQLCSDIMLNEQKITVWFSVETREEEYLCKGAADPFVMAILPIAVRSGHDIMCEDAVSARLYYQMNHFLIPIMTFSEKNERPIQINAALRKSLYINSGAVGTDFLSDLNSLFMVSQYIKNREYPLTHIAVFNTDVAAKKFQEECRQASDFAQEQGLKKIFVDTNLGQVFQKGLKENLLFYRISCVLALQGLFSVYLFSDKYTEQAFDLKGKNRKDNAFLITGNVSTESLSCYLTENDGKRVRKNWPVRSRKKILKGIGRQENSIRIGKPYIEQALGESRLCAKIEAWGKKQVVWFSVNEAYGTYLTSDRCDAFVIAFLMVAMRCGSDILCDGPVTRRLLYQMNNYLIPLMASNIDKCQPVLVSADATDAPLECEGAVVTGWTGGVDSLFTYMQNSVESDPEYKLTHLLIANNGAIEGNTRQTFRKMIEKAENGFARETGLKVIGIDSNLQEILNENFLAVLDFRHGAVVMALQKLFRIFLVSSSLSYSKFLFNADNSAYYEMFILNLFPKLPEKIITTPLTLLVVPEKLPEICRFLQ